MPNGRRYQMNFGNSPHWKMRLARPTGPCPGWIGDTDKRPFRFERWHKLPEAARKLYWRIRPHKQRYPK